MDCWPLNPYFSKGMLRDPAMFFGRTDLLRCLYEAVAHRQCVSVVGSRGIGKSSLLWYASLPEIQARFSLPLQRHIFVFLDLREYLTKASEDFFHSVSRAIIAEGAKAGLTLQQAGSGGEAFSNVLDQIEEEGYFPVLLLDAFDKVTLNQRFDERFFEFLRAHASIGQVSYITTTQDSLARVCHREIAGSPFFNIFYEYSLDALTPEETSELINRPLKLAGMPFTDEEIQLARNLAGRHPFLLQRVCYVLYENKRQRFEGKLDVHSIKSQAYKDLKHLFEDIWSQLSSEQYVQLLDEAQQKERHQRILPELSESSLFRQFVRNTCHAKLFDMTIEDLKDALEKIDDLQALGEVNLRLIKPVSLRLQNHLSPSIRERGAAIREVLKEALEELRGTGARTSSAPDWKIYNILDYCYFHKNRYSLTNDQVNARLELKSDRQFYREKNKALCELYNILVDRENKLVEDEPIEEE